MLKSEPQVHPNAKKLFPLKYPAQTPLIIVRTSALPLSSMLLFLVVLTLLFLLAILRTIWSDYYTGSTYINATTRPPFVSSGMNNGV